MKLIAADMYSFESLIERGYTYVDKTRLRHPFVYDTLGRQFFLRRLRCFWKSTFISVRVASSGNMGNSGIDAVPETYDHMYVMVFKRNKSVAEALVQIKKKRYRENFLGSDKEIILIVINFDSEKCDFDKWMVERVGER